MIMEKFHKKLAASVHSAYMLTLQLTTACMLCGRGVYLQFYYNNYFEILLLNSDEASAKMDSFLLLNPCAY